MANNLFAAAKGETKKAPAKKGKVKPQIEVADLHQFAALTAAAKAIESHLETLKESVNEEAFEAYLRRQNKETLEGIDGDTTASLQLKKRTSRSTLSEAEIATLEALGVETQKSADSKFYINGDYAEDGDLLQKVSDALEGIVPEDFFGHTGDKFVVGDNALVQALEIKDESDRRVATKIVSTQAARCKFGGTPEEMLEILSEVMEG